MYKYGHPRFLGRSVSGKVNVHFLFVVRAICQIEERMGLCFGKGVSFFFASGKRKHAEDNEPKYGRVK